MGAKQCQVQFDYVYHPRGYFYAGLREFECLKVNMHVDNPLHCLKLLHLRIGTNRAELEMHVCRELIGSRGMK